MKDLEMLMVEKINSELKAIQSEGERISETERKICLSRVYGRIDMLKLVAPKDYVIVNMRLTYKDENGHYRDALVNVK